MNITITLSQEDIDKIVWESTTFARVYREYLQNSGNLLEELRLYIKENYPVGMRIHAVKYVYDWVIQHQSKFSPNKFLEMNKVTWARNFVWEIFGLPLGISKQ